jgi:hypothetical protein
VRGSGLSNLGPDLAASLDRLWIAMFVPDRHRGAESKA